MKNWVRCVTFSALFVLSLPNIVQAAPPIQMLPPKPKQGFGENCADAGATSSLKIIAWDGRDSMRCRNDIVIDPATGQLILGGGLKSGADIIAQENIRVTKELSVNEKIFLYPNQASLFKLGIGIGETANPPRGMLDVMGDFYVDGTSNFKGTVDIQGNATVTGSVGIGGQKATDKTVSTVHALYTAMQNCIPQGGLLYVTSAGALICKKQTTSCGSYVSGQMWSTACSGGQSGNVIYQCNNGTTTPIASTCNTPLPSPSPSPAPTSCEAVTSKTWSQGSYNCSAYIPSIPNGTSTSYPDIDGKGSLPVTCTGGVLTYGTGTCGDPCAVANPLVGTLCPDGSFYAGKTPNGGWQKMFAMHCDLGQSWDGNPTSPCVGTRIKYPWNNGTGSGVVADKAYNACEAASVHGRTDWHLPTSPELDQMKHMASFTQEYQDSYSGSFYWSATSCTATNMAHYQILKSGKTLSNACVTKHTPYYVRCIRKG